MRHRLNENDETTLLPATIEELAASERDEAEESTGSKRRPVVLAAVATSVLLLGTASWVVAGQATDGSVTADPIPSRSGLPYVDGFGQVTASPRAENPPISRGPARPPAPSASPTAAPAVSVAPQQPLSSPAAPPPASTLLSRGRPASSSSTENDQLGPSRAVDGDINTRWGSAWSDPQWIRIDLGTSRRITRVQLRWEVAHARQYEVQVSTDGSTWRTVSSVGDGNGGIDDLQIGGADAASTGRYVRILGIQKATEWGFSLWELEIWGR